MRIYWYNANDKTIRIVRTSIPFCREDNIIPKQEEISIRKLNNTIVIAVDHNYGNFIKRKNFAHC